MYVINSNLVLSTSTIIEILEHNSFMITSDESGVFIYDSRWNENIYCPYKLVGKELSENTKAKFPTKELMDKLLYYRAIHYCTRKLTRVRKVLSDAIKQELED